MFERYSLIGVAFSLAIIVLDFYVLRKRRIQGKAFVLWFTIGLAIGLFSTVPYLFELLSMLFGMQYLVSVTATGFLILLLMIFYLYYKMSELHSLLMKLAMEVSVERYNQKQTKQDPHGRESENNQEQKSNDE